VSTLLRNGRSSENRFILLSLHILIILRKNVLVLRVLLDGRVIFRVEIAEARIYGLVMLLRLLENLRIP
jgi:hypothetical protein